MSVVRVVVFAAVLALLLPGMVSGLELEYYGIESRVLEDNNIENTVILIFNESVTDFVYTYGSEITRLTFESNHKSVLCGISQSDRSAIECKITPDEEKKSQFTFEFGSENEVEVGDNGYEFNVNYPMDYFVRRFSNSVYLPQTASLNDLEGSFSPKYGKTITDGKRIIILWEKENVISGDDLHFSISYQKPLSFASVYNIAAMVVLAVIIIVSLGVFYMKSTRKASVRVIMPILKGDEKRVVDILMDKNGAVNQKVVVRETDFSKAKVSRIMKNLKERGVVEIEHLGRTNRVKLLLKNK
ncbi:MAG: hypothetical protein JW754_02270 [Candidatus Aenigmarchaeota archaeon]|nr:hypothetical protein [Candidatus Aenigmarchaeota archaeon]